MTLRDDAIAAAESYFDEGHFKNDLANLVSRPTESQDVRGKPHLDAYLSEDMRPRLEQLGFEVRIHANPISEAPPILTAERIEDAKLPTILIYGHGDVVLGQTEQWREGLHPFQLVEEGDTWFGRGTADNKGQHLINISALAALIGTQGHLGFNAILLIEMGEEAGSPGLKPFCEQQSELLKADVLIASDGPRLRPDTPTIFTGSRGAMNFDLSVTLRDGAHHSGNFGGLLADPAMILSQALATITDAKGQIQIPEWRPTSLTPKVREIIAKLPAHDTGIPLDPDWGEADLTPAERVFGWNSFAILAMTSGVPEAPLNAIAGEARATCQLRFVVGTDDTAVLSSLRRHLDQNGFEQVKITPADSEPFTATRVDPEHPYVGFVVASLEKSTGTSPHLLPNLGGSLPNECFAEVLGLPTIWIPHSYAGCSQHAPNEHVLKHTCRQALTLMTGLFADIASDPWP